MDIFGVGWRAGQLDIFKTWQPKQIRGKRHQYTMSLDLSDWSQRITFFTGEYYETAVLAVLDQILDEGDVFVDIGTNIGMVSLHARHLVGSRGFIHCFEPNPICASKVRQLFDQNGITNYLLYEFALGSEDAQLELRLTSTHSGTATLANVVGSVTQSFLVDVKRADSLQIQDPKLVKIDVEGFELHALRGMSNTLREYSPYIITEIIENHLARAGTTIKQLSEFLGELGYKPHSIGTRRKHLISYLEVTPVEFDADFSLHSDYLWIHQSKMNDHNHFERCLGFAI